MLAQFYKVKILHVPELHCNSTKKNALHSFSYKCMSRCTVWIGSFCLRPPEGEVRCILVTGKRLVTPLPEALPFSESERVCRVKIATEPSEDWRIPCMDFLERGSLLDYPSTSKSKHRLPNSLPSKECCLAIVSRYTPPMFLKT